VAERCGFCCGWDWCLENSCIVFEGGQRGGGGVSAGASPRQFGSTSDDIIYALLLFPRPAIPWKCELVRNREDSLPNCVLAVLISSC
jgi:hypothetical protein